MFKKVTTFLWRYD